MSACNCMGPQNGDPLCPCQMAIAGRHYGVPVFTQLSEISLGDVQRRARIQIAMEDAILRMDAADLSATAEYNALWAALADFVGVDEIEYRQAFWQVDEKGRQHRRNPLKGCQRCRDWELLGLSSLCPVCEAEANRKERQCR